ncbi:MAG: ubiquinone/menaquinone biosynthesis methyltransferase [Candidatus Aminicenantes bacterium]|nr:ubiquinone/menaquinone biosynthesis methyltransferase [Candidatus Aminicenantes bacterium]
MKKGIEIIYSEVAPTYELINHVMTFGLDIYWRWKAARLAEKNGGCLWLDICSGTGEMIKYLKKKSNPDRWIAAVDASLAMLLLAKKKNAANTVLFSLADADRLPFTDDTFDLIIIGFAARNLNFNHNAFLAYLKEFRRILKPGGLFLNLETSQPRAAWIKKIFHLYVKSVVKPLGYMISGSKAGYAYLSHTIPRFYDAGKLSTLLSQAEFREIKYKRLLLGIAAIHTASK